VRHYVGRPLDEADDLDGAIESLKHGLDDALGRGKPAGPTQQSELVERLDKLKVHVQEPENLDEMRLALPRFLDISKGVSVN
jgi:hypothetical protein